MRWVFEDEVNTLGRGRSFIPFQHAKHRFYYIRINGGTNLGGRDE